MNDAPEQSRTLLRPAVLALAGLLGVLFGLGMFTFVYAEGTSYLSNNPETCMNCHIMREQFEGWNHSSHKAVAVCNDCHTPHNPVGKWAVKAWNGLNHSWAFTTGNFPEPIRIKSFNADIVQANCVECHRDTVSQIITIAPHDEELRCVTCHGNVGHRR